MTNRKYTAEFKAEAVKQITEWGYKVTEVSERIGVLTNSLYKWLKQARGNQGRHGKDHAEELRKENLRLKNELKRVEEERDIFKKAAVRSEIHISTRTLFDRIFTGHLISGETLRPLH